MRHVTECRGSVFAQPIQVHGGRVACTCVQTVIWRAGVLAQFIREFFDQNPLSHLGIIVLRGGIAERLTDLSGNPVSAMPP